MTSETRDFEVSPNREYLSKILEEILDQGKKNMEGDVYSGINKLKEGKSKFGVNLSRVIDSHIS
jgi:hypothetical protein